MRAVTYLKDTKIKFISTNEDLCDPGPIPGLVYPASGCMTQCISTMTGRKPIVMGKPHTATYDYIFSKFGIDPKKSLMIGDRCDTDIVFGNIHGMDTMLALTGICQVVDVKRLENEGKFEMVPKYFISSIGDLLEGEEILVEQGV